jgi:hypothetical protein
MVRERAREAVQMVCRGRGRRPVSSCGVGSDVIDAQSSSAWVGECALVAGRVVWERNVPCTLGALAWVGWSLGRDPKSTTAVSTMRSRRGGGGPRVAGGSLRRFAARRTAKRTGGRRSVPAWATEMATVKHARSDE